jgi:hypothetical protein
MTGVAVALKLKPFVVPFEEDNGPSTSGVLGGLPNPNPTGLPILPLGFANEPKGLGLLAEAEPNVPLKGVGACDDFSPPKGLAALLKGLDLPNRVELAGAVVDSLGFETSEKADFDEPKVKGELILLLDENAVDSNDMVDDDELGF